MVTFTHPGETPNDSTWKINIPENVPCEIQEEIFVRAIIKREELLEKNKNMVYETKDGDDNEESKGLKDKYCYINERTSKGKVRFCMTCEKFKVSLYYG